MLRFCMKCIPSDYLYADLQGEGQSCGEQCCNPGALFPKMEIRLEQPPPRFKPFP